MSVAADLVRYLGGLTLSGGDLDGEPLTVWGWERKFLRGAFRDSEDSALTVGRGNGKSALLAGVAAAVVDPAGPLHRNRAEVVVVASSFDQSRIIYEDVLSVLRVRYDLESRRDWRKQDSSNRATLEWRASGARIRCIGSDPRRAHGLRPKLVLADEPAQWETSKADRMLAALRTGLGKVPGSKLVALGTRPDGDHWFSKLLKSGGYSQVHAAAPDDPPFTLRTIRKANPSLEFLPSLKARILEEREGARTDPDRLAEWKALRLNLGTPDTVQAVLLDAGAWRRVTVTEQIEKRGGYVLGIDLGSGAAMSAAAAYFPDGRLDAVAAFPELPSLAQRGIADGVGRLYQKMADRGELVQAGRRVADVRALFSECLSRWGRPVAIVCDRWREKELRDVLENLRFPSAAIVVRGQGFRDGGEDVRDFRRAVLGDLVYPVESLLLTSSMAEARVTLDPAGNAKLAKNTQGGRRHRAKDDAAAAAILAVAAGYRQWQKTQQGRRLRSMVV